MFQPEEKDAEPIGSILDSLDIQPPVKPQGKPEQPLQPESSPKGLSLWKASGVTERHGAFKPEMSGNEKWTAAWYCLKRQIGHGVIAIILGGRGAGKTQMSACAIRESCKAGKSALYTKALSFFLDVRKTYSSSRDKSEKEIIQNYVYPNLLVIDAIENRSDSAFENLLLNYLIDLRYDSMKDTIIIGNLTEQEFAASMGVSIVDRIHECGIKIICDWPSFRRKI